MSPKLIPAKLKWRWRDVWTAYFIGMAVGIFIGVWICHVG